MIRIKDLTVKNFMSVGNQTQAVNFDREQLTLVLGENLDQGGDDSGSRNGTGKTTIVNALSFALYGQALTNIKKDNLINKINNKNMLVTLTFNKDGVDYRVERGRKPNVMKFFVNNQEQASESSDDSQGDMRETQKDLDELLGMSHTMFRHILALNTYTEPFLSMKTNEQREIIEQLLGITLLSEKAESLKEQIRISKDSIYQENADIEAAKKSNEKIQISITGLETRQKAWYSQQKDDCAKIIQSIAELQSVDIEKELEQHAKLKVYDEQSAKIKSLNKEKATLETAVVQADKSVNKYSKEVEQLKNKTCPACEQELHTHKHEEMTAGAEKNLIDAQTYLDKVSNDYAAVVLELETIGDINGRPKIYYDSLEAALKHQNNLASLESALSSRQVEVDPYQEQIDDLKHTAIQEISWDNINAITTLKDHQEFLLKLLTSKDSFIRKKIIDQNLAYLNNRLTYYLDKMGLPHQVNFQNDLSVEITQLGQDLDFDNLSRGERNRLILGLSWSFRDVWESLYQNINLLFIDELIDNGLDSAGVESALSVLKKMARERNKNIYLISHKDELIGRVTNVLKVIKENGYTSYSNDIEIVE
jgi:DNA repair exonuclease SbcCD ATPase subunit